jgi:acyl carrier protein
MGLAMGDRQAEIAAVVRALLGLQACAALECGRNLRELGLDSRKSIELAVELERHFAVEIPDHALVPETFDSVSRIHAMLERLL